MFAKHEIVDILSKRLNKQRLCLLHEEPFIMYNAEDKVSNVLFFAVLYVQELL